MFESVKLTMKYYFDVLDMHYVANLFVNQVEDQSEIEKHPYAMKEAHRLGSELVTSTTPPPEKPIDIQLT